MDDRKKTKEELLKELGSMRRRHSRLKKSLEEGKRAEGVLKLFSAALEEAPDGIQIVDMKGKVIYSNKAVKDIYGFSPDELMGMHVNDMNADPEFAGRVILPGIRNKGRWEGELTVKHKTGREFPIWLTTSLVRGEKGEPLAMVGVIRDMTGRRRQEEERERLISELKDALASIKTLKGLIPVCAWCRKVRDDRGYLRNLEAYIKEHTEAKITHGICPECMAKLDLDEKEDTG
jgi:PAS domain S-box-containing protein